MADVVDVVPPVDINPARTSGLPVAERAIAIAEPLAAGRRLVPFERAYVGACVERSGRSGAPVPPAGVDAT